MAASIHRESLARLRGERADAVRLLEVAADHVLVRTGGAAQTLLPLEIFGGSELREVRAALQRRPGSPAAVATVPAYQVQPSPNEVRMLPAGGATPGGLAPVGPVQAGWVAGRSVPPQGPAATPAEGVLPPPRGRKRYVAAAVTLSLLAVGWLSSLGSDDTVPRHMAALAESKQLAVQQVTSTGLVRLVDPTGTSKQVELAHLLLPAPGDCLGPEAAAEMQTLLPVGAMVTGHETGELTVDGVLVAAELARAGLAVADPAGAATDAEFRAVAAAEEEARATQAGLFSPSTACTVPAQVAAYVAATAGLSTEADKIIALAVLEQTQLDGLNAHINEANRTAPTLAALLAGSPEKLPLAAFTPAELEVMRTKVAEGDAALAATVTRTNDRIEAENTRLQAEADKAAESQRLADEQAAREAAPAAEGSSSGGFAYYPNCTAAKAAGAAPLYVGGPGYRSALDRDKDGVACE